MAIISPGTVSTKQPKRQAGVLTLHVKGSSNTAVPLDLGSASPHCSLCSTSSQTCGCWGGLISIEDFAGLSQVSKPCLGQVFSCRKPVVEPVSSSQGRLVGCSCGRCSWAGWLALILWKPIAPAAWEFWANAQPWHGPLLLTPPVQVPVTDAGNICCELIRSSTVAEDQPVLLSAPVTFAFGFSQCLKKIPISPPPWSSHRHRVHWAPPSCLPTVEDICLLETNGIRGLKRSPESPAPSFLSPDNVPFS